MFSNIRSAPHFPKHNMDLLVTMHSVDFCRLFQEGTNVSNTQRKLMKSLYIHSIRFIDLQKLLVFVGYYAFCRLLQITSVRSKYE